MEIIVTNSSDGQSLLNFLKTHKIPFGILQKLLRKGNISIDGVKVKENIKIQQNQKILIKNYLNTQSTNVNPKTAETTVDLKHLIIYEDQNILIINKPNGMATQGGDKITISVDSFALQNNLKLVHRLDKNTSGVLILAKTSAATRILNQAFKNHLIKKTYLALVNGIPNKKSDIINIKIKKQLISGEERMIVCKDGQEAITEYKIIQQLQIEGRNYSLLELQPITGKKHQLRITCLNLECPIVGDTKYYVDRPLEKKMFLHAKKIIIDKSVFGKEIKVECDLPAHFQEKVQSII